MDNSEKRKYLLNKCLRDIKSACEVREFSEIAAENRQYCIVFAKGDGQPFKHADLIRLERDLSVLNLAEKPVNAEKPIKSWQMEENYAFYIASGDDFDKKLIAATKKLMQRASKQHRQKPPPVPKYRVLRPKPAADKKPTDGAKIESEFRQIGLICSNFGSRNIAGCFFNDDICNIVVTDEKAAAKIYKKYGLPLVHREYGDGSADFVLINLTNLRDLADYMADEDKSDCDGATVFHLRKLLNDYCRQNDAAKINADGTLQVNTKWLSAESLRKIGLSGPPESMILPPEYADKICAAVRAGMVEYSDSYKKIIKDRQDKIAELQGLILRQFGENAFGEVISSCTENIVFLHFEPLANNNFADFKRVMRKNAMCVYQLSRGSRSYYCVSVATEKLDCCIAKFKGDGDTALFAGGVYRFAEENGR